MKRPLLFILLLGSLTFTQTGFNVIGGITYSKVEEHFTEEPIGEETEHILGYMFGIEKTQANGLITGLTYSQRGFLIDEKSVGEIKYTTNYRVDYLTGYFLQIVDQYDNFLATGVYVDIFAGGELGYFLQGNREETYCIQDICLKEEVDMDASDWKDGDGHMLDYGLVFGSRVQVMDKAYLVGSYYFGIGHWADGIDAKNRSFKIYISYSL